MSKIRMKDLQYGKGMFQPNSKQAGSWDNPFQDKEALKVVKKIKKK